MKQFFLIFLFTLVTNTILAQNTLDLAGLTSTNTAIAAYSLRKLSSTYIGSAIQVRRSSDSLLQDIGFTPSGDLDQAALLAFTGMDNGYVSIWYDQSGNGYNTTGTANPIIVTAGVINLSNGIPSILFNGNLMGFSPISPFNSNTDHTLNAVAATTAGTIVSLSTETGTRAGDKNSVLGATYGASWYGGFNQNADYAAGTSTSALSVRTKTYRTGTINGFFDGSNIFNKVRSYNLTKSDILIGAQNYNPNQPLYGSASEIIVFTTALTAPQRLSLESNQGTYYGIAVNSTLIYPTISTFGDMIKFYGNVPFTLTAPTSNSLGAYTYISSNPAVATIVNNTVTIVGGGSTTITASQEADPNYGSGTIVATLTSIEKGLNRNGQLEEISSNYLTKNGSVSVSGLTQLEINQYGKRVKTLAIGDSYGGGIIAYIFQPGEPGYVAGSLHGLIAAVSDQSSGAQWGCGGTMVNGTSSAIGSGKANTIAILNGCSELGIAARICDDYSITIDGRTYDDWYLPSREELNQMYYNRAVIGGFVNNYYWSSTESDDLSACRKLFSYGNYYCNKPKTDVLYVRAIRSF